VLLAMNICLRMQTGRTIFEINFIDAPVSQKFFWLLYNKKMSMFA